MGKKTEKSVYEFNGISIEQRQTDGFINGTAMCTSNEKDVADWLANKSTLELLNALARRLGQPVHNFKDRNSGDLSATRVSKLFPALIVVRRGSPANGGGTWIHHKLAVQLAQWCNAEFALLVSDWVEAWLMAYSPIQLEVDADRVKMRDTLKDHKRLELTDQIKAFLEAAGRYDPKSFHTRKMFWDAHDKLNILMTTETAKQMRLRLEAQLGRKIKENELLRDYYPIDTLAEYAAMCQAAANEMIANNTHPLDAIDIAVRQVLPRSYLAAPIDFSERIELVRRRLEQRDQLFLADF